MPLCPSEVMLDLVAVDRIATVMTWPVAYKSDEISITGYSLRASGCPL